VTQRIERLQAIRDLLASQREGVLSTLAARHGGYPFGSLCPYALTDRGEPILLLSQLAEHTRNLLADPRASLFVQAADAEDSQDAPRVTLLGTISQSTEGALRERYVERHPRALEYLAMADFGIYLLSVEHVRFVAGFGEMGWLSAPFD
jgi:putative heme iron utilization protein